MMTDSGEARGTGCVMGDFLRRHWVKSLVTGVCIGLMVNLCLLHYLERPAAADASMNLGGKSVLDPIRLLLDQPMPNGATMEEFEGGDYSRILRESNDATALVIEALFGRSRTSGDWLFRTNYTESFDIGFGTLISAYGEQYPFSVHNHIHLEDPDLEASGLLETMAWIDDFSIVEILIAIDQDYHLLATVACINLSDDAFATYLVFLDAEYGLHQDLVHYTPRFIWKAVIVVAIVGVIGALICSMVSLKCQRRVFGTFSAAASLVGNLFPAEGDTDSSQVFQFGDVTNSTITIVSPYYSSPPSEQPYSPTTPLPDATLDCALDVVAQAEWAVSVCRQIFGQGSDAAENCAACVRQRLTGLLMLCLANEFGGGIDPSTEYAGCWN